MTPPVQRLAPGVVLLTGPGVDALRYCVQVTIRARTRNGQPASLDLEQLLAATTAATVGGQEDSPNPADRHDGTEPDWTSTTEAAQMLGCSPRQARRLAPQLGGIRTGGRWFIDRQALTEHQEGIAA